MRCGLKAVRPENLQPAAAEEAVRPENLQPAAAGEAVRPENLQPAAAGEAVWPENLQPAAAEEVPSSGVEAVRPENLQPAAAEEAVRPENLQPAAAEEAVRPENLQPAAAEEAVRPENLQPAAAEEAVRPENLQPAAAEEELFVDSDDDSEGGILECLLTVGTAAGTSRVLRRKRRQKHRRVRQEAARCAEVAAEAARRGLRLQALFQALDTNGDGMLDCPELLRLARLTGFTETDGAWVKIFVHVLAGVGSDETSQALSLECFSRLFDEESKDAPGGHCTNDNLLHFQHQALLMARDPEEAEDEEIWNEDLRLAALLCSIRKARERASSSRAVVNSACESPVRKARRPRLPNLLEHLNNAQREACFALWQGGDIFIGTQGAQICFRLFAVQSIVDQENIEVQEDAVCVLTNGDLCHIAQQVLSYECNPTDPTLFFGQLNPHLEHIIFFFVNDAEVEQWWGLEQSGELEKAGLGRFFSFLAHCKESGGVATPTFEYYWADIDMKASTSGSSPSREGTRAKRSAFREWCKA